MAFTRVKPANWSVNEKLTSTQMNTLDTQAANAVDKTSAGDTISGPLTLSGAGRIVRSVVTGANADTTYQPNAQRTIRVTSAITGPVSYTLGTTGVATGDTIEIFADTTATSYVNVLNSGTTIWRVGKTGNLSTSLSDSATFIYTGSAWVLLAASRMPGLRYQLFTSATPTTWTCPPGVYSALVTVCGGGGGGAGGMNGALNNTTYAKGGGGGGAAMPNTLPLATTPATSYAVAGGAGGAGGAAGNPGVDGSPSYFDTFYGRGGGGGGISVATGASDMSAGGTPGSTGGAPCTLTAYAPKTVGQGGFSASNTASATLKAGSFGWQTDGAAGGSDGSDNGGGGGHKGGGGGGGGASGPRGAGGVGGNGGNGDVTLGTNGANGTAAGAGSGAGGGGGGGGGGSATTAGTGGSGGAGGTGYVIVVWG